MEIISGEWGESKVFYLPFVTYGATDYLSGVSLATGDVQISRDGAAFTNITTLPTILGKWMLITLSATEMQAGIIAVQVIDQTATKIFEDTGAILSTNISVQLNAISLNITKILGLVLVNHVEDDIVRDTAGNKTSCSLYCYDSSANATTHDKSTGLLHKFDVSATYTGNAMDLFKSLDA